jgi:hypothetical protein
MSSLSEHFALFTQRRFWPFWGTNIMNLLNDNIFKNALIFLFSYQALSGDIVHASTLINICAAVLILPYILFSGYAGQFSDKFDKALVIRCVKFFEILVVCLGCLGFYFESNALLISALFLLGTQSTFLNPVKYSFLPQHIPEAHLMRANGFLEMGSFFAIFIGTILGTLLMSYPDGNRYISVAILCVTAMGWIFCLKVPTTPSRDPNLKIEWNPFVENWAVLKLIAKDKTIFLTVLAIAWFWFFGSIFLSQIPSYTMLYLGGDKQVVSTLYSLFAISIGIGAMLCDRISTQQVEVGLIPFGMIGLTAAMFDFTMRDATIVSQQYPLWAFIQHTGIRPFIDTIAMGVFCGIYLVPLYTLIQKRTPIEMCSRVIAGNNIVGAFFMVMASVYAIVMVNLDFTIADIFWYTSIATLLLTLGVLQAVPEFVIRFIAWILVNTLYRVEKEGLDKIPKDGPAILVCNHVSFLDPVLILAYTKRPVRFIMWYTYHNIPLIGWLFKKAKTIPIAGDKEDPSIKEKALKDAVAALRNGELVGLFPEGTLTKDGELGIFRGGILQILEKEPVPVIPIAVKGLWGSFFSCKHGRVMLHFPRNWFKNKIGIVAGEPLEPEEFTLDNCKDRIQELRGDRA